MRSILRILCFLNLRSCTVELKCAFSDNDFIIIRTVVVVEPAGLGAVGPARKVL